MTYTRKNYQYCTLNGVISICIRYVPIRDTDAAIVTTSVFKMKRSEMVRGCAKKLIQKLK